MNPEHLIESGNALIQMARTMERTFPKSTHDGSQHDEDAKLAELLPDADGIYVDCGASHSSDCSNTAQFYKRGWRGLLIEPLAEAWPGLLLDRAGDFVCPIAASDKEGIAMMRICRSISSLQPYWPLPKEDVERVMPVKTARLSTILARYPSVDWSQTKLLSVDVEGHEKAVLEGIDWNMFKPAVVVIEWASPTGEDISAEWRPILEANGYRLHHANQLNQIWTTLPSPELATVQ